MAFKKVDFDKVLRPENFIGRAPKQVDEFMSEVVMPIRRKYRSALNRKVEHNV